MQYLKNKSIPNNKFIHNIQFNEEILNISIRTEHDTLQ